MKPRKPATEPAVTEPDLPESPTFATWLSAKATQRDKARISTAAALLEHHNGWAVEVGAPVLTATMFGRRLAEAKLRKTKIGGKAAYIGIALKNAPELRVVSGAH